MKTTLHKAVTSAIAITCFLLGGFASTVLGLPLMLLLTGLFVISMRLGLPEEDSFPAAS